MSFVPRYIPLSALSVIINMSDVATRRRVHRGMYGPTVQTGRHQSLFAENVEKVLGRAISDEVIDAAYIRATRRGKALYHKNRYGLDLYSTKHANQLEAQHGKAK